MTYTLVSYDLIAFVLAKSMAQGEELGGSAGGDLASAFSSNSAFEVQSPNY